MAKQTNIPQKVTGFELSATEFNELNNNYNQIAKEMNNQYLNIENPDIVKIFENNKVAVFKNTNVKTLVGLFRNIAVWADSTNISLSLTGIDGTQESIAFNSTNFPGLISGSTIEHVILLPWTRNATTGYAGLEWRMNVITTKGQVYHNYPSRAASSDGVAVAGDHKLFEESCVWELPERWTPVKTTSGGDADLIATGKYKYFPALPDECYEMHPPVNAVSSYGNTGFPATVTKTKEDASTEVYSRFYFTDRSRGFQGNPLGFMGGFAPDAKLSILATYKQNSADSTRICLFMTNDGGRNWFCRFEYGANGKLYDASDVLLSGILPITLPRNMIVTGHSSVGAGVYNIKERSAYAPTSANKEPELTKKFKYGSAIAVSSITPNAGDITVVTATAHGLVTGSVFLFEKQNGTVNEWDWIVSTNHTAMSAGNGVLFKVLYVNSTTFILRECVYNPHNPLYARHIHCVNKCKDGFTFGAGETYPLGGWVYWIPVRESDSYARKYPWDNFEFIRLNSTLSSVQRPLGVILKHDSVNSVYVGIDNETTDIGSVSLPTGRTPTFKRSSNGVFKGALVDIDSQAAYTCIFESPEVCYFFKEIEGVMIYIGQQGHCGISTDNGNTWSQLHIHTGDVSRYGGVSDYGFICVSNFIFKGK